jgi:tetratricopeptide (TPR) repeat protein
MNTVIRLLTLLQVLLAGFLAAQTASTPLLPPVIGDEEVQRPAPFTDQESRVLRSMNSLPVERLVELLKVYEKLDNTAMMDALIRAILRRDPANKEAILARDIVDPKEEMRSAGYLEEIARKIMRGEKVEDIDSVEIQANAMTADGRAAQAVQMLLKFRANQFAKERFPFLDDLAYALSESGSLDEAIATYEEVAADGNASITSREEAKKILPSLRLKKRIAGLRAAAGGDGAAMVAASERLLKEMPGEYEAQVFHVEALDTARRYDDAVAYLLRMKGKSKDNKAWPWEPTLAYAYFGARRYDEAISSFRGIMKNPAHDPIARIEAEEMILEIQVSREIENGLFAMERADMPRAQAILAKLERDYPTHRDVMGYRAIYMAKTGRAREALDLLQAKKRDAESQGLPFSQQDALADVYLEMKDYRMAIAATREILDNPLYDYNMRNAAMQKLHDIAVLQTVEAGYNALIDGRRAKAKGILASLQSFAPGRLETRVFQAEVALAYNKAAQALAELEEIRPQYTARGVPFSGQLAYGSALYRTGRWEESFQAYDEILSRPGFSQEDIAAARSQRREILPLIRPHATFETYFTDESEGQVLSTESSYTTAWWKEWRATAFARHEYVDLQVEGIFGPRSESRIEGGVTLERRIGPNHFAEITLGGHQDGLIAGARVGRYAHQQLGWSLGYIFGQHSTESLSLMALNGRENRAEFRVSGPLSDRWVLDFVAYHHTINVDGDSIGDGYGFEGAIDFIIQTETRKRPEISIGYFGQYHKFNSVSQVPPAVRSEYRRAIVPEEQVRPALASRDEIRRATPANFGREVFDTLVDPETNRHGLRLTLRKQINDQWSGYIQAGGYYAFDDETVEFMLAAGMEYYISDSAMLYAEVRYDSSGRAANTGSGVFEANLGALVNF